MYSPESIVVTAVVLPLLAVIAVFLRFLVRLRIQPTYLGADDWLVLGAVIFALADGANLCVGAILGILGRDWPDQIPQDRSIVETKSDYAQLILEKPLYAMMKLSALFFYRRIFSSHRRFLVANTWAMYLIVIWSLAYFITEIFQCGVHPDALWNNSLSTAYCVDRTHLNLTYAVTDVIGDMLVVAMPFPVIRRLHMDRRQKAGVTFIFLLGTLSTVAAIIRLAFICIAVTESYGVLHVNLHGATTPPSLWSTVEGSVGVLAACLPPLGPLIRRIPQISRVSGDLYHRRILVDTTVETTTVKVGTAGTVDMAGARNEKRLAEKHSGQGRRSSSANRSWRALPRDLV